MPPRTRVRRSPRARTRIGLGAATRETPVKTARTPPPWRRVAEICTWSGGAWKGSAAPAPAAPSGGKRQPVLPGSVLLLAAFRLTSFRPHAPTLGGQLDSAATVGGPEGGWGRGPRSGPAVGGRACVRASVRARGRARAGALLPGCRWRRRGGAQVAPGGRTGGDRGQARGPRSRAPQWLMAVAEGRGRALSGPPALPRALRLAGAPGAALWGASGTGQCEHYDASSPPRPPSWRSPSLVSRNTRRHVRAASR